MKKIFTIFALITLFSFSNSYAQLANGSVAPDFTLTDLNGTTHNLYDYIDDGYTVFLDFSAVWCGPCWSYHNSGALEDLYINHGPSGLPNVSATTTNDVMVFFIEGDGSSVAQLNGGSGSLGDWVAGTPYPIICTDGNPNSTSIANVYSIGYWPTVYQICPNRILTECGQTATPYSLVSACLPPPSQQNDARSFMTNSASSGCSSVTPEINVQNYGLNNLTEVKIDVSVNGLLQSTTIYDTTWNSTTSQYEPLNLNTLDIVDVLLDPITGLVNNDLISIDVSMPNGVVDADPSNNQTISYIVDLGFDNAYWDGDLSITVSGAEFVNSWYLKKVSNGLQIASGWGGVTGVSNWFPLEFEECYTLQSINGGGESYTVTDFVGNIVLQGTISLAEEFDNFSTGAEVWTGVEDEINNSINIYPNPVKDNLFIEGQYDYLEIFDLFGRLLISSNAKTEIDVSKLSSGTYVLEIISNNIKRSEKIIISK